MSAEDWADRVKAALAGGASLATLIALVDQAPADASPGLLLSLLQQIAALLCDEGLDQLVDLDGLWQRGGQAVLNGWDTYVVSRLWRIDATRDQQDAQELRHRLALFTEDLEKAGATGTLPLRMIGSPHFLQLSSDALVVANENLAHRCQAFDAIGGGVNDSLPPQEAASNIFKRSI